MGVVKGDRRKAEKNQPIVKKEILSYRRGQKGKPYRFLDFEN